LRILFLFQDPETYLSEGSREVALNLSPPLFFIMNLLNGIPYFCSIVLVYKIQISFCGLPFYIAGSWYYPFFKQLEAGGANRRLRHCVINQTGKLIIHGWKKSIKIEEKTHYQSITLSCCRLRNSRGMRDTNTIPPNRTNSDMATTACNSTEYKLADFYPRAVSCRYGNFYINPAKVGTQIANSHILKLIQQIRKSVIFIWLIRKSENFFGAPIRRF
jgi:hypothetical protein